MLFKTSLIVVCVGLLLAGRADAQPKQGPKKIPVLIDTDIGDDIDDAIALALALVSPELEVRGITTVTGDSYARALLAGRLLKAGGYQGIPVAAAEKAHKFPDRTGQMGAPGASQEMEK